MTEKMLFHDQPIQTPSTTGKKFCWICEHKMNDYFGHCFDLFTQNFDYDSFYTFNERAEVIPSLALLKKTINQRIIIFSNVHKSKGFFFF